MSKQRGKKHLFEGKMRTVREISDMTGVPTASLYYRLSQGMKMEKAGTLPKSYTGRSIYNRPELVKEIYDLFVEYKQSNNGINPTVRYFADHFAISSSVAYEYLSTLRRLGLVTKRDGGRFDLNVGSWNPPRVEPDFKGMLRKEDGWG